MSRHRRRPPIRLRRQWEREAAAWWSEWNRAHPPWASETRFTRVYAIWSEVVFDFATGRDGTVYTVRGIDGNGSKVVERSSPQPIPRCPVRTFPRR